MGADKDKKENPVEHEKQDEPKFETLEQIQKRQIRQARKKRAIRFCIFLGCLAIALIVFLLYRKFMEPQKKYKAEMITLKNVKTGDSVVFGTFEQDQIQSNGQDDIDWIVLDKKGNKALLLTKYCLIGMPYNSEYVSVTWESCSLREWLNTTFFETAFNPYEQKLLLTTRNVCNDNPVYNTDGGNDTEDKVFLLSNEEVKQYLVTEEERQVESTQQALRDGVNLSSSYGTSWWWLRNPGDKADGAMIVTPRGEVSEFGHDVVSGTGGVRIAIWIDLSKS